jgi:hypothetical protein
LAGLVIELGDLLLELLGLGQEGGIQIGGEVDGNAAGLEVLRGLAAEADGDG